MSHLQSFQTSAQWTGSGAVLSADGCTPLLMSQFSTRELVGPRWFPEALLVSALEADLMNGIIRLARRDGLKVLLFESDTVALLIEDGDQSQLRSLVLRPRVVVDGGAAEAQQMERLCVEALSISAVAGALRLQPEVRPTVLADRRPARARPAEAVASR
jgi:organic hydroperoxide reductase OsmC/OhrA